jgi:hypothetical protein
MVMLIILGIGIFIYLLIGWGVAKTVCSNESGLAEEEQADLSLNNKGFFVLSLLTWPIEFGAAISRVSIYYGGSLAKQRWFKGQPAPEIVIPAIAHHICEIKELLKNIDEQSKKSN